MIEWLYKEMTILLDSLAEEGRYMVRAILVTNKAHNYLNQNNLLLGQMIHDDCSEGAVVFSLWQSLNNYQKKLFNLHYWNSPACNTMKYRPTPCRTFSTVAVILPRTCKSKWPGWKHGR